MKKAAVLLVILLSVLWSCQYKSQPENHDHETGVHSHGGEELHLSPAKQKEWGIEVETVKIESTSSQLILPGIISLNKNRTAQVSSFVPGQISSLSVDLGDRVRPGQPLVVINAPEFGKAKSEFLEAWAKLNLSRQEYDRAKRLLEDKAIEEKEFLRRKAEYEKDSVSYGALGARLHSFGITHEDIDELIAKCTAIEDKKYKCEIAEPYLSLLSPIAGTVIFRDVVVGEPVDPGKILLTVSDLKTLWAELDVYEKDIPYVSTESEIHIRTTLYPEKAFSGKITYVHDVIDEKLRTVKVRAEVKNTDKLLKPNMFIQGVVENKEKKRILLSVPDSAIQTLQGEKVIFVAEGEIFSVRRVELGRQVGNRRIITKGLIIGQQLVTKGAFYLKTELTKETFGHTHVH